MMRHVRAPQLGQTTFLRPFVRGGASSVTLAALLPAEGNLTGHMRERRSHVLFGNISRPQLDPTFGESRWGTPAASTFEDGPMR